MADPGSIELCASCRAEGEAIQASVDAECAEEMAERQAAHDAEWQRWRWFVENSGKRRPGLRASAVFRGILIIRSNGA